MQAAEALVAGQAGLAQLAVQPAREGGDEPGLAHRLAPSQAAQRWLDAVAHPHAAARVAAQQLGD